MCRFGGSCDRILPATPLCLDLSSETCTESAIICVNLPSAEHVGIDKSFFATSVGRLLGNGDQLFDLDGEQGEGDRANAFDLKLRRKGFDGA
jgi:hypothetical protein